MSGTKISALQSLDPVSGTSVLPLVSSGTNYKASLQAVKEYVLQGTSVQGVQGRQGIQGSQGIQGRQGAQGTAGEDGTSSNLFFYNANTGAFSGNPGSGSIIWNNASQKDSTAILISHLNSSNVDIDIFLALLRPTEKFTVQDANVSSNYQTWRITGSPTNYNAGTATSYWSFPVELVSSAGTGTTGFANLHALFVALVNGVQGVQGVQGIQGAISTGAINQTIILNTVGPSGSYTAQDVTQWSASYTGTGGQLLVTADVTAYSGSTGARNWYLKKNTTTVATGNFFINSANMHMTLPALRYIDTSGSTSSATWSITLGSSLVVDAQDRATITVTEYTGISSINVNTLTASGNVSGQNITATNASGDEGGEVDLAKSPNSSLSGDIIVIDQYIDRVRFFEAGGTTRGAYIDLKQAAAGVGTLLNNRVSGFVNAGTFVTMDNLKATVTTSSNRGLSLAAVSGSFNIRIAGTYATAGTTGGSTAGVNITTTPTTSMFGWDFVGAGDLATYVITDTTNNRAYRVTMHIGYLYNDNTICIERLV